MLSIVNCAVRHSLCSAPRSSPLCSPIKKSLNPLKTTVGNVNRNFTTSHKRAALPPVLFVIAKPLARIVSLVVGRGARKWWKRLPEHKKLSFSQLYQNNKKKVYTTGALAAGGLALAYESHVQECPITHRRRFVALTPDQAKKIGDSNFKDILEEHKENIVDENHPVYDKVAGVANKILKANKDLRQIYDKTWTLTVIHDVQENAFVLPSGNIFVFTGMIEACENSDELGIVLSHEIAHVVLGHVEEKLTLTSFIQLLMLVPMAVLWAVLPNDGVALVANWFMDSVIDVMVELPFSREMETEADKVGLFMAAKACIDVREAPAFWGKMKVRSEDPLLDKETEFASTHPCHETRQQTLMEMLESAIKFRSECGCERLNSNYDPLKKVAALAAFINSRRNRSERSREI